MKIKQIDLRHLSPAKAKKAITRLYNFKKRLNLNVTFKFQLPDKDTKKKHKKRTVKKCPYCSSILIENDYDLVCSSTNIKNIIEEIKNAKIKYADKAELFIGNQASRYYHEYMVEGDGLICKYKMKEEESKFV